MKILEYNNLVTTSVTKQYKKILEALSCDDFYTAEVKKLAGTPFYRAKLDYANRLLFQIIHYHGETYALILEVIHQHDYAKSRFLNGAVIKEENIKALSDEAGTALTISYINPTRKSFNILDKIVSFDETQASIFEQPLPLILIGSAGSGKTTLTLEKMKQCTGDILYVTHSPYLVEHSRAVYYGNHYQNENQNIDFLSFKELLETIKIPEGQPLNYAHFKAWFTRHQHAVKLNNSHQVFEEFRGVLTGSDVEKSYLSRADYLNLGIKQSIFTDQVRNQVYDCFERYLAYLKEGKLYDPNIIAHQYLALLTEKYDFVILDEVQDFTNIQIHFLLKLCKNKGYFIFCGDSNQIVHPNFFSWAKVKTMLYSDRSESQHETLRILHTNYRNSDEVTAIANRILKIKQQRFGSIDKESNYLISTQSQNPGEIYCALHKEKTLSEINQISKMSTKFAILVMKDEDKAAARKIFQSPLVFSIHEAKGLEYQNIVLVDFISKEAQTFSEICEGISLEDLDKEHHYARAKNKNDKSLEAYKFYINSFYVAITRSVQNLYVIESKTHHPFLALLGLRDFKAELSPQKAEQSSREEWQKEAHKLEMQGKLEQADAIRSEILKQKTPPWTVLTKAAAQILFEKIQQGSGDKAQKLQLLEYGLVYEEPSMVEYLKKSAFHPAQNTSRAEDFIRNKYYLDYSFKNMAPVLRSVNEYGVNFRNPFNETPLMSAVKMGNETLTATLMALGADPLLTHNRGLHALQQLLQMDHLKKAFPEKMATLYERLSTQSLSIEVDGQLIKIDPHKMEFFLFHALAGLFAKYCHLALQQTHRTFYVKAPDIAEKIALFSERILFDYRKKRTYISSILSKNEMFRKGPYNNRLFYRLRTGCYIINPRLKVKQADSWITFYDLIGIHDLNLLFPGIKKQLNEGA